MIEATGSLTAPSSTVPHRDYLALRRGTRLDLLLQAVDVAIHASQMNGLDPPRIASGWGLFCALCDVTAAQRIDFGSNVTLGALWRLVAVYLEARQETRRWYELSGEEVEHLAWTGGFEQPEDDEQDLPPRALVLNYLYRNEGRIPSWFRPLPEV